MRALVTIAIAAFVAAVPAAAQQLYFMEAGLIGFLVAGTFASYSRLSFLYLHVLLIYLLAKALEKDYLSLRARLRRSAPHPRIPA